MAEKQHVPGDPVGMETLVALAEAERFNEWMYDTIKRYCSGPVFEIGSGIGNISSFFIRDEKEIFLSDLRPEYCEFLNNKFSNHSKILGIDQIDLVDEHFDDKHAQLFNRFKSVYALNVVEHIDNDGLAIENAIKLLVKGGQLVILVPAYTFLYNAFDEELGHFRRYNKKRLSRLFEESGLQIIHKQYFNMPAMFGWMLYGSILKRKIIPKGPVDTYNKLVPLFKIADKVILNRFGNSVILVGRKN